MLSFKIALFQINNQSVAGLAHFDILALLRDGGNKLRLVVERDAA